MNDTTLKQARLKRVPSGIAGLDEVLYGGFLEAGVYIFIGQPGAGKTIFANQIAFHHARANDGQVVYISLLAESHARLFAHMDAMAFFDESAVSHSIHYTSGYQALEQDGLNGLLQLIRREIRDRKATMLVLDGLVSAEAFAQSSLALKKFVHELQTMVSLMGCTAFLLTSGSEAHIGQPEHTMVDGLIELQNEVVGVRQMRSLYVKKFRGSNSLGGAHAFEITNSGVTVYPRLEAKATKTLRAPAEDDAHCGSGIADFDVMLGGGVDRGAPTMVLGPAGSGKTLFSLAFLRAGLERGEPCTYFGFHESPERLIAKAARINIDLARHFDSGLLDIKWQPNVDFLADALVDELLASVRKRRVKRLVVDSLVGLKSAILVEERLSRFLSAFANELRVSGVTTYFIDDSRTLFAPGVEAPVTGMSAIVDNIFFMRQVELHSQLHRVVCVLKTREYNHDQRLRTFTITSDGIQFGDLLQDADKIMTGIALYNVDTRAQRRFGAMHASSSTRDTIEAPSLNSTVNSASNRARASTHQTQAKTSEKSAAKPSGKMAAKRGAGKGGKRR